MELLTEFIRSTRRFL